MGIKNILYALAGIFFLQCSSPPSHQSLPEAPSSGFVSWLPATTWEDALLTGNGTIGAMVMGYPYEETVILNHALLYLPNEKPVIPPNMAPQVDQIRKLSFEGNWEAAAQLGVKIWEDAGYGAKKWTDPYVPAADLKINMPAYNVQNYQRTVNYETAEATVDWEDSEGIFSRSTFASRADSILVTRITGSKKFSANIRIQKHPHSWTQNEFIQSVIAKTNESAISDHVLQYHCEYGKPHDMSPIGYDGLVRVVAKDGKVSTEGSSIQVQDASEVLIFTTIDPYYSNEGEAVDAWIEKLQQIPADYNQLLANQKNTHGKLFNAMKLDLKPTDEELAMTSETLVKRVREHTTPGIIQRQFEAARYNILCATGINPPNLQGIWSGTWTPPWSADFTHDGNVEVAVSHFLNGNMPELIKAYFNYHERLLPQYQVNAQQFYGARGIHVPSHTSTHGYNNHYDDTWTMEYWNSGAGWTASFFYDYYLYTADTTFLKEHAFPFISESLDFWEDFLIEDEQGKYIVVPSYSPENNPLEHKWQNCINATMDFAVIKELVKNWISAAKILGVAQSEIDEKRAMLDKIPEYQISDEGVIKEWMWPGFTDNQAHRHASHLYGLYEVPDMDILNSPELLSAAAKTIKERMKIRKQYEGGEMAFGMCLMGNSAVNIGDAATAEEVLRYLSKYYWTNSLATTHNPGNLFNMDISGGFPSLITRMLVNSRPGHMDILSALPEDWKEGATKGIRARGDITISDLKWSDNGVALQLSTPIAQTVSLKIGPEVKWSEVKVNGAQIAEQTGDVLTLKLPKDSAVQVDWK